MHSARLVIVSNRLPASVEEDEGEIRLRPSAGGLVTGLRSVCRQDAGVWIGWPGQVSESRQDAVRVALASDESGDCPMHPVFIPPELVEPFYEGFANGTLWPLLHSFPMYARFSASDWEAYKAVNRFFADEVLRQMGPDDTVWVHDYHLMLLPRYVREAMPEAKIGFFLHIPFPNYDILRLLPQHRELVGSLLAADLIGFHTYDHAEAFLAGVRRLLGYDNNIGQIVAGQRVVQVDVFPMGIDYWQHAGASETAEVQAETARVQERLGEHRLICSVSRLDYTKGVPQHLEAVEEFFDRYPEWIGRTIFMLLVVPSRENVERYADLKREIDEAVGRINSKYGTFDWMPIWYVYGSLEPAELAALYAAADVALITPLRDGMNLVAKEYVAARRGRGGVLVLSETAGAAKELLEALVVNPNSKEEIAEALNGALTMPTGEQERRNQIMNARLEQYNVSTWAENFLQRVEETAALSSQLRVSLLDGEARRRLRNDYASAQRRLLLLDYDGTLVPFAARPDDAAPGERVCRLLEQLASSPRNEVVVVSGREPAKLAEWLSFPCVTLVAEHGAWVRPKGQDEWQATLQKDETWKSQIRPLLDLFVNRIPGSFIEEKTFSLAWHYRRAEISTASAAARELIDSLTNLTANRELTVLPGKRVVEIKQSGVSKGGYYNRFLAGESWDFTLAMGDDWTDESLFRVLPSGAYSIRVGFAATTANFNTRSSESALSLLEELAALDE